MRRVKSIFLAVLLFAVSSLTVACNGETKSTELTVRTVDSTQKILQDVQYDDSVFGTDINVTAARNEYEGWQVILSASNGNNSVAYDVKLNDLTDSKGNAYSCSNIKVYHELYISVSPTWKEYYTEDGMYPDAMIPIETAKKYNENVVSPNRNQGLYFEFYVPSDQVAGDYVGKAEITYSEKTINVPVRLSVRDFTVSEETHAKSLFLNNWDYYDGELDSSQEMHEAYIDALADYRLCANGLLAENNFTNEDLEKFTELAYKYACRKDYSTISIPFKTVTTTRESVKVEGKTVVKEYNTATYDGTKDEIFGEYQNEKVIINRTFDEKVFCNYVESLAQKSFETGVNILKKCVVYFTLIDEPQLNHTQARVKYVSERFEIVKQALSNSILTDESINESKLSKREVSDAICNIANVVTTQYEDEYEGLRVDYCPNPSSYNTEGNRELYKNNERWWYCCVGPNYPYPTYHIDDHLLSTRLLYWMASEYDVVGNLNWGVNSYSVYGEKPEDYYQYAIHGSSANGEGFLFYPGKKYGIYGPVGTNRLQAYRDGIEEYEIQYAVKEKYVSLGVNNELDFSAETVLNFLGKTLYSGTTWATSENNFYKVRNDLYTIAEMAENDVCVLDISQKGYLFNLKVYAKEGSEILFNDERVNKFTNTEKGKIYEIAVDMRTSNLREVKLTAKVNGKEFTLSMDLGGAVTSYAAENIVDSFSEYNKSNVDCELVSAVGIGDYSDGSLVKLTAHCKDDVVNEKQSMVFKNDLLNKLNKDIKTLCINVYSECDAEYEINFLYNKGATVNGKPIYSQVLSGNLKAGENSLEITNLDSYNWAKYEGVTNVLISVKGKNDVVIYVRDIVLKGV